MPFKMLIRLWLLAVAALAVGMVLTNVLKGLSPDLNDIGLFLAPPLVLDVYALLRFRGWTLSRARDATGAGWAAAVNVAGLLFAIVVIVTSPREWQGAALLAGVCGPGLGLTVLLLRLDKGRSRAPRT